MDQRPIIYLLPGLLCDQDVWQHQSAALSQHAEVRIPDFKGLDSLEKMADLVLDEAPEQFSVIGHSMGGRVGSRSKGSKHLLTTNKTPGTTHCW
jgi:pimeloyl-ACP methyl ester carboxylesterase